MRSRIRRHSYIFCISGRNKAHAATARGGLRVPFLTRPERLRSDSPWTLPLSDMLRPCYRDRVTTRLSESREPTQTRLAAIDVARGVALVAMAVYHFSWDLQFFGYLEPGTATTGPLKWFARSIATSFLFLVGVSLVLATANGLRWKPYSVRLAKVAAAALLITVATWFFTPSTFVFFGILHHIALASVIGLAFVKLHWSLTLAAAVLAFFVPDFAASGFFDRPLLWWTGLSPVPPPSNDFVPLFPWISAVLAGIAATGAIIRPNAAALSAEPASPPGRGLAWLGKHSLAFYLIHQPVLIGLVAAMAAVVPPGISVAARQDFLVDCQASCSTIREGGFCERYCACFLDTMDAEGNLSTLFRDGARLEEDGTTARVMEQCTASSEE